MCALGPPRGAPATALAHADSYYAATATDAPIFPSLEGEASTEVCVVGGGLAGLTVALELAKARTPVSLLEANFVGWGASGRNGGFVSPGYSCSLRTVEQRLGLDHAKSLHDLAAGGVDYVRETISELNLDKVVVSEGKLLLCRHARTEALRREMEERESKFGETLEFWDKQRVRGTLDSPCYFAGIFNPNAFTIHPLRYCQGLAKGAEEAGAKIYEGSTVISAAREGQGWLISTAKGQIRCRIIVYAASAYGLSQKLFPKIQRALLPIATYMVASESCGILDEIIGFPGGIGDGRRAGDYYRRGPENRLLWGGRITTRAANDRKLARILKSDIARCYPGLKDLKLDYAWSGLMGYARHLMPVIGEIEPGLWAATAFGGHGLNTTAMAGNLVASGIAKEDRRWKLFSPFGPRWAGGKLGLVATQLEYWRLQALDRWDER
ncbi:MAG: FAD-dependent oxidoreductase [Kiloniellales bacterium]|nr:FAD-dependent oxidoreductase [Kiloniellales bacterium]